MGGNRNPSPHDGAYSVLIFLTLVSVVLLGPLVIAYLVGIYSRRKNKIDIDSKNNI